MAPEDSPHPPALAPATQTGTQTLQADHPGYDTRDDQTLQILQADHPGYGTRSMIKVAFNLVNAIVGAGIIGLPFTLKEAGFWGGLLVSGWVIVLTHVAMYILILSGRRIGIYKYALLAEHALGKVGFHTINFMLFFQTAGAAVGYYIIIGDTIPVVLGLYFPEYWLLADRGFIIILVSIIFITPLCLPRSIGAIANWSILSVLLLPIILLSIIIRAPAYAPKHDAPLTWIGTNVFPAIGIMAFAFISSHVALMNYLSLKEQRSKTWGWISAIANGTSWAISMAFAIVGYMSFGVDANPNLFNNFEDDDVIINIGRFSLGVSLILTVPMCIYPARSVVQKSLGYETATRSPTNIQHYVVTFVLSFAILAFGVWVRALGKVYQLVGGVASTFLAYIVPGLAYLAVYHPARLAFLTRHRAPTNSTATERQRLLEPSDHVFHDDTNPTWWLDAFAVVLVAFGAVVMVLATYGTLAS